MSIKANRLIRNFKYTLFSNFIAIFVSVFLILVVPKVISLSQYGYWQLYIFYSTYIGFLHFGWNDGIYLRYGGLNYDELEKKLFFSQFYMLTILQLTFALIIYASASFFTTDESMRFIIHMTSFCIVLVNTKNMLLFILQCTNRIIDYAKVTMLDRVLYVLVIAVALMFGAKSYQTLVILDIFIKAVILMYVILLCKEIVFNRLYSFFFSFVEAFENIRVGIKLMFSNIASMLIIGVVRFGIEKMWSVEAFGKVSLVLSIANFMMIFINSVGIVIYPVLRRVPDDNLVKIYVTIRDVLIPLLFGLLFICYPLKIILTNWLTKYSDSLPYLFILFPVFMYEGKMVMLINTYLKTMRKEKLMMRINLLTLALSCLLTYLTTVYLKSLNTAVLSILIVFVFRSVISEIILSKTLKMSLRADLLSELALTAIFTTSSWYLNTGLAVLCYLVSYCMYLFMKKSKIVTAFIEIKKFRSV